MVKFINIFGYSRTVVIVLIIIYTAHRQYTYTPDPEILSLFWNFETDVTDEVGDKMVHSHCHLIVTLSSSPPPFPFPPLPLPPSLPL